VVLYPGLIDECGGVVKERAEAEGLFVVSTLKEPYRVEGKKTMGYDVVHELGEVPEVIVYPTGGGTGIVGMWKAFDEMEAMGWIDSRRPRMVTVQATGCAPIVKAFEDNTEHATRWQNAKTTASGLRVPAAVGDFLVLNALRESNGTAIAVDDTALLESSRTLGAGSGVLAAPEGGACLAAAQQLAQQGWIQPDERVVLFNTGTALSYASAWSLHRFATS